MKPLPFIYAIVVFSVGAWAVNRVVSAITGRTIEGNLDAASDKVLSFVRPDGGTTTLVVYDSAASDSASVAQAVASSEAT